jgi:hypothetical protein
VITCADNARSTVFVIREKGTGRIRDEIATLLSAPGCQPGDPPTFSAAAGLR